MKYYNKCIIQHEAKFSQFAILLEKLNLFLYLADLNIL